MKRVIGLALCIVLGLAALCGCGAEPEQEAAEVPTLTWYMVGNAQSDVASVMEAVNQIIEPKIGAKLNLIFLDDNAYNQRINLMMAAGDEFDICFTGYTNKYTDALKQGTFLDISEYLQNEAKGLYEAVPEYLWQSVTVNDGEIYAVPNQQINSSTVGLFFLKQYVDKYNYDITKIKTMADLEEYLQIIKENEPELFPVRSNMLLSFWPANTYENVYGAFYVRRDDPTAKLYARWDLPEYQETQARLRQWFLNGYIRNDASTVGDDSTDWKAGRYAVWNQIYKPGCDTEASAQVGQEVVAISIDEPYITTSMCTQTMNAISVTSKHPLEAIKLLELVNTDKELYNLLIKGIEGKHYTKIDDQYIKLIDNSGYAPNADWKFGNQFNALLLEGTEPDVWEETARINTEAQKSILLGFNPNLDDCTTEIAQMQSAGAGYSLSSGSMDMTEKHDEYVEKMRQAGAYTFIEKLQAQIDAFLAE